MPAERPPEGRIVPRLLPPRQRPPSPWAVPPMRTADTGARCAWIIVSPPVVSGSGPPSLSFSFHARRLLYRSPRPHSEWIRASDSRASASRSVPGPGRASASFVSKSRPPASRLANRGDRDLSTNTSNLPCANNPTHFCDQFFKKSSRCRPECVPVPGCPGESQPFRVI